MKFLIWKDDARSDARIIESNDPTDAVLDAADVLDIPADKVNILAEERFGEAAYYGVEHAVPK